ncbi:MAG: enolase C-terminal domain-like protein, partial [Candidatus Pacebacteria bacterium]|nr:enolase C-terminal domain-like protein [Candidatus Paceibacterota bacterium]
AYLSLKEILLQRFGPQAVNVGYEGGFAPDLSKVEQALDLLMEVFRQFGSKHNIHLGLDVAASEFYQGRHYNFEGQERIPQEMAEIYQGLTKKYPLLYLEDPFSQDDMQAWRQFTNSADSLIVVGDDLTTTNPDKIKIAKEQGLCNAVIIKPNQIGTVTETLEAVRLAQSYGWQVIVSHRSGETTEDFIADLAVGVGADFVKFGAPARGERVIKYNRLLEIEGEII